MVVASWWSGRLVKFASAQGANMVDTFQVDRKAWELAKAQLTENAPHSTIALLAEEIKRQLIEEEKGKQ